MKKHRPPFHIGRFGEILSILIKFGFGDFVSNLNIEKYISFTDKFIPFSKKKTIVKKVSRWERIRLSLEELGPAFIKFGQFMSNRPDLFPEPLIIELEKLQDSVLPFPSEQARHILEEELPTPLKESVSEFIEKPIASASIAQVHEAKLDNGETVVFKIQRPHIQHTVKTDMDILYHLALLSENRFQRARDLKLSQIVKEFTRTITREMDFTVEASHIERFREDFESNTRMYIPKVFRNYTTKRVLTTEFVKGIKITDTEELIKNRLNPKDVAIHCVELVFTQLFDNGFFHADPHPGNILVRYDGSICFIDFGAVGIIPPTLRYHLGIILYGLVKKDSQKIVRTLSQLTYTRITNIEQLEYDVTEFIEEYSIATLKYINIGEVLQRFANIVVEHNIKIIPGFYLLLKTLISLEGVILTLDPEFRITHYLEPFVKRLIKDNPRHNHVADDVYFTFMDMASLIKDLPFELKDALRIVKSGDLRIQFEHHGLESMLQRHDQLVNRLVYALVLAALIIGSSIVIHSGIPPIIFGIPLIGLVGFIVAAILGFGMILSMLRGQKL